MRSSRARWGIPLAAVSLVATALLAPSSSATPAPAPAPAAPAVSARLADPNAVLASGWQHSTDRAVTTAGDDNGLNVLVADASTGYQWRTAASLSEPGFDADQWLGQACLTGSGRRAVVTYAPRTFANDETASDAGAFAAIVDLSTGAVTKLPLRVSLAYYDPGCGAGEDVALSTMDDADGSTSVEVVDAATGTVAMSVRTPGQLTSAVPFAGGVVGALGDQLVSLSATGVRRTLSTEAGVPFRLAPDASGGLDFQVPVGRDVQVRRFAAARSTLLGTGALGSVQVAGSAGHAYLIGPDATRIGTAHGALSALNVPADSEISSTGALAVTAAQDRSTATTSTIGIDATVTATAKPVAFALTPQAADPAQDQAASPALSALGGARAAPSNAQARAATDPGTVPWDPDRGCSVPRNDPTIQTFQATANQVEWAADLAVQGKLTIQRSPNWEDSGMPVSWAPQGPDGMFPLEPLTGGGSVPAQVLLAVLAQESNTMQASPHAVDGVTGNFNQGGFYGNGTSWSTVDCGYGVGQVTTGMAMNTPAGTPIANGNMAYTTAEQQQAVATDYASNIAASLNLLILKWNQLKQAGIIANNGDPSQVENWYLAVWAYNSGIQPDSTHGNTTGCNPGPSCTDGSGDWGLGWFNNPANPRVAADRPVFTNSTADTSHPNDWTYPELIMGWSGSPVPRFNYQTKEWGTAYAKANWTGGVLVPAFNTFCTTADHCTPDGAADPTGAMQAGLCSAVNSDCWWHSAVSWVDCTKVGCGTQVLSYAAGAGEPTSTDPYPPDCDVDSPLPSNAVIVDDTTEPSAFPCGKNWTDQGSFTLNFPQSDFGSACSSDCVYYQGKIDFHQVGVGFGGHIWFTHTVPEPNTGGTTEINDTVTGTWTPPSSSTGWTRIEVHVPDSGGATAQADYVINLGNGQTRHRMINQHWNVNTWVDLGTFDLSAGASVSLSNATPRVPSSDVDGADIAFDAMAFVPSVKPTVDYVALGDSYSAGQGVSPYNGDADNDTDNCHRSPQAYPYQITEPGALTSIAQEAAQNGAADFHFLACSGATTVQTTAAAVGAPTAVNTVWSNQNSFDQAEPYQIDDSGFLDQDTTLVTLSLGGDDARFAAVLKGCIITNTDCTASTYHLTINGTVDPQILTEYEPSVIGLLEAHLEAVYRQIHQLAPNAKIIVLGYPQLFSAAGGNVVCDYLSSDTAWLNQMAGLLDTDTGQAVSAVAAADKTMNITFVDPTSAFLGHDSCQPIANAWLNALIASSTSGSGTTEPGAGSFHPNATGQYEFAQLINGVL